MTQKIMLRYGLDDVGDVKSDIQKCAYNLSKYFKTLWEKHNRKENVLLKRDYFQQVFVLPHSVIIQMPSTSSGERGRKELPFSRSSDCVKRRKTTDLRQEHEVDELTFASVMKLRSEGRKAEASVIKLATQTTPTRAERILKMWGSSPPVTCIPYSEDEALALICDAQLTASQYNKLR